MSTTVTKSPIPRRKAAYPNPPRVHLLPQDRGRTQPSSSYTGRFPVSGPLTGNAVKPTRPLSVGVNTRTVPVNKIHDPVSVEIAKWKRTNRIRSSGKVFIIEGDYPDVRKALVERGWVENTDVRSAAFDMKWTRVSKLPMTLEDTQIINHFRNIYHISAKSNFTFNLKRMPSEEVDKFYPRTYALTTFEKLPFTSDFKCSYVRLIQAEGVLKTYVSAQTPKTGNIRKVAVALGICQRVAQAGKPVQVLDLEWLALTAQVFKEVEQSLTSKFVSRQDFDAKITEVLHEISHKHPQSGLNQGKNIWIYKPGSKSRGRDIALATNLAQLESFYLSPSLWIVQKYIENPMLIQGRKFDIRQWVLVTSFSPLTIWFYEECYLRFSAEAYSDSDLSNKFIHLTNNSIVKYSKKFHENVIDGCMMHIHGLQEILKEKHGFDVWKRKIQPRFKEIVKFTLEAVKNQVGNRKKSFELLGYDFLIDTENTPWLLEVNTSPAMDYSTVRAR